MLRRTSQQHSEAIRAVAVLEVLMTCSSMRVPTAASEGQTSGMTPTGDGFDALSFVALDEEVDSLLEGLRIKQQCGDVSEVDALADQGPGSAHAWLLSSSGDVCRQPARAGLGKSGIWRMAATILSALGSSDIAAEASLNVSSAGKYHRQPTEDGTVGHMCRVHWKSSTAASPSLNATQRAAASVLPATVQAHVRQQRQGIPTWSVGGGRQSLP